MSKIEIITVPENKEKKEISDKVYEIVRARNEIIAKDFKVEPRDITVKLIESTGAISAKLGPNGDKMGVFAGYVDGTDEILLINPQAVDGLFTKLWPEMGVITDFTLVKLYLCKKYYPEDKDFKMYHKYISQVLAEIVSGKYKDATARFDFKMHTSGKIYKKDKELGLILYLMKKHSGTSFIFEHLDTIMNDLDIKKSIRTIYKKNLDELIKPEQDTIIEEDKKLQKAFNNRRRKR